MSDLTETPFALPLTYSGGRQYFTMPTGFTGAFTYKLWGAGGAGGGNDSGAGGNGAGGGYIEGSGYVAAGSTVEIYVGQGGRPGISSSGGGGGRGGGSYSGFGGGSGGSAGPAGWSGGGGGGGGATVLKVDGQVIAVGSGGGGGGGGGNRGPYNTGENASGNHNTIITAGPYSGGQTNGAWSSLLNTYSVWEGNGNYIWYVYFPATADATLEVSVDNYGTAYLDGTEILSIGGYNSVYSTTGLVSAGWHNIRINGINTGGPGSLGARIIQNGAVIWTSRDPQDPRPYSSHGAPGGDCPGDGGGGGGGGGGYFGGAAGDARPWYDNGGYAGSNGTNFILGQNPMQSGQYPSYTTPGNASGLPSSSISYGGPTASAGHDGYALLTFYKTTSLFAKAGGQYRKVTPWIKRNGAFSTKLLTWVKVSGVWKSIVYGDAFISISSDDTSWSRS